MIYKHYNTLSDYYKNKYHKKVSKISINLGLSCPNKDGTKGYGGCTYCSSKSSGDFAGETNLSIKDQFYQVKDVMDKKWPDSLYVLYFQAGTNTHTSLENLNRILEESLNIDSSIVEISIATRADALDVDKIKIISKYNKKIPITVELGLQTSNENTAKLINRCHTNKEFEEAVNLLHKEGINVVAHIMNGLPGETKDDMLNTIDFLNKLKIDGIKIHALCIISDSRMGQDYLKNPFKLLSFEEYVNIVIEELRHLNKNVIIHRLSADAKLSNLIEPKWTYRKKLVMNEIDRIMNEENIYQGDKNKESSFC